MGDIVVSVEDSGAKGAFVARRGGDELGRMTFSRAGDARVIADHTEVSDAAKGQGVGQLMFDALVGVGARPGRTRGSALPLRGEPVHQAAGSGRRAGSLTFRGTSSDIATGARAAHQADREHQRQRRAARAMAPDRGATMRAAPSVRVEQLLAGPTRDERHPAPSSSYRSFTATP